MFKPMASRPESSETYLLALRYKAPAKIPSHLLDYRQLFKYTAEPKRMVMIAITQCVWLECFLKLSHNTCCVFVGGGCA